MNKKTFAALIFGMAVVLAACGNKDSGSTSGAKFNDQDVTFAQGMIPHHRQAVVMAKFASTSAGPQVKELASAIQGAQDPEITAMTGWLKDWDKPLTDDGTSGMDHGSDGDDSMSGMMSDADMKSLESATGTEFDTMFLTMMIRHHEGAITMADAEIADGKSPEAIALAKTIRDAQTGEIATMKGMLKQ